MSAIRSSKNWSLTSITYLPSFKEKQQRTKLTFLEFIIAFGTLIVAALWLLSLKWLWGWRYFWLYFSINIGLIICYIVFVPAHVPDDPFGLGYILVVAAIIVLHVICGLIFARILKTFINDQ